MLDFPSLHLNDTIIGSFDCSPGLREEHPKIIIFTFGIFVSITAFLGNVLIISALPKVLSLHPPSKLLFGCLASTDLCVGLMAEPLSLIFLTSPEHSRRCWYAAKIHEMAGFVFCSVSLLTLTAISVDRLLALMLRLRYRQVVTLRRAGVLVVIFWLGSVCTSMIHIYNFSIFVFIICVGLFLLLAISTFCYFKIYLKLRHHQAQVQDHANQGQPNGGGIPLNIARYRKTVSSALWVQSTLLMCYLPFGIFRALRYFSQSPSLNFAWLLTVHMLMFNSTLNPILYCWKLREVRHAVKDTIRKLGCFLN